VCVADAAPTIREEDLRQWKLLEDFRQRLEPFMERHPSHRSWEDPKRKLPQLDYLSLFLCGLINPVVRTMRGLCAASHLKRVQAEVCTSPVSRGSFSEAQHVLEPKLLEGLLTSLMEESSGPMPRNPYGPWQDWLARDGSIFPALSRMVWARYGCGKAGRVNNAVRLHVSFNLFEEKPAAVEVTPGRECERKSWRRQIKSGATYVGDRYYAEDYKMFALLEKKGCHFILRLRDEAVVHPEQEIALPAQAPKTRILSDQWAHLGVRAANRTGRLRVITIRKSDGKLMRLVTNIPPEEMSARDVQVLYRRRWQIECFFRWLKCLMGVRHWLAESQVGATVQLYLALIAGLMLQQVLGRRPNKRIWERLQLYLMGWATLEELMSAVQADQALKIKKA
jgi:hypothetical protein